VRVFYGDTDQMGVAYYANYLRWFEMARNEYLRAVGFPYRRVEAEGIHLPVVEAGCRYLAPARYDDWLQLEAWIEDLGRVRVRFAYRIRRGGEADPLATGFTVHASLTASGSPCRVPASLVDALRRFDPAVC
jgi:acyl-CoA thioester hydrolase